MYTMKQKHFKHSTVPQHLKMKVEVWRIELPPLPGVGSLPVFPSGDHVVVILDPCPYK